MITTSKKFDLNWFDLVKGLIVAVVMAVLTILQNSLVAGSFDLNWKNIALVAAGTAISYLLKNFFTPPQIVVTNPTAETAYKVQNAIEDVRTGEAK
jgi:hypothetical protein